jgi:hypothetical protein
MRIVDRHFRRKISLLIHMDGLQCVQASAFSRGTLC